MSSFGLYNFKTQEKEKLDLSMEVSIFDLEPAAFRREIASRIRVGREAATSLSQLYKIYIYSVKDITDYSDDTQKEYARYRDKTTKRVRFAAEYLLDKHEELKEMQSGHYYWTSTQNKNLALNQETTQGMSISRAMVYSLVQKNFVNLLPPSELESLEPYFEAAKQSLENFSISQANKLKAADYNPFAAGFIPQTINAKNHETIFSAIENNRVIKAKYSSIHGGIPEEIIFSPQKIRVQFQQTQVIGFVHNTDTTDGKIDDIVTHVNDNGIYRHLTLNNFLDIEIIKGAYKVEPQPTKKMLFVAYTHEWVTKNLGNLKISEDQNITPWQEMNETDKAQCKKMRKDKAEKWSKVTATIELPKAFLDFHDQWDAWFFVNAISMYGADLLVVEPTQVVDEIKRRVVAQSHAYT